MTSKETTGASVLELVSLWCFCNGLKGPKTHRNCETCRHSVEVVGVLSHGHHLGDNRTLGPFHPKHFSQLPQVSGCRLPNGEDGIAEPSHAEVTKLLIEKLHTQLASKKGDIFDDGKSDTPLLIFS